MIRRGDCMDHRFREDENELPYLVSRKRDKVRGSKRDTRTGSEKLDSIINGLYVSDLEKSLLRENLMELVSSKDFAGLRVEDNFTGCSFIITRENDYVTTVHEFIFDHELFNGRRIFWDCYTTHSHDRLLSNQRFRQLINNTSFEFLDVVGGYECRYSFADDSFTLLDEINVRVSFRVDSATERLYHLDLDSMTFKGHWDINTEGK
jgi:hypothetical protein